MRRRLARLSQGSKRWNLTRWRAAAKEQRGQGTKDKEQKDNDAKQEATNRTAAESQALLAR